ncbi:MAG: fimbrillin family protein [Bacteroidales bacterium]
MRNLAVCLAACGLIFASCSSNEVFEENKDVYSQDVINLNANTTRASVNGLDNVKEGFAVLATSGSSPASWFLDGETTSESIYKFFAPGWNWSNGTATSASGHKWPVTAAGYPMNFYAYFPYASTSGFTLNKSNVGSVTAAINIAADPAAQTDYLGANYKNVTTKPASGKLNLMFRHITSKVNFGIIAGNGSDVYVQQIHMQNVGNTGTFNYNDMVWNGLASETGTGKYKYFPKETVPSAAVIVPFLAMVKDEVTNNPVFGTDSQGKHDRSLMLRPQNNTNVWDGSKNNPAPVGGVITPSKAYIESVYRIEANGDVNAVGYKDASVHPDFATLASDKQNALKGKPLFVKVGFPLGSALTWGQGKGYMYKLKLGTADATGGIIIDDNYYDEKGNRTDLTNKDKDPGDPVNDGNIHFNVDVTEWEADTDGSIRQ